MKTLSCYFSKCFTSTQIAVRKKAFFCNKASIERTEVSTAEELEFFADINLSNLLHAYAVSFNHLYLNINTHFELAQAGLLVWCYWCGLCIIINMVAILVIARHTLQKPIFHFVALCSSVPRYSYSMVKEHYRHWTKKGRMMVRTTEILSPAN